MLLADAQAFCHGFVADALADLVWAQIHGATKRLRVVASLLVESGLAQERTARTIGQTASMPRLTADVALSLLDDRLVASGSTHGVTREEIDLALTWLTSPYVWPRCVERRYAHRDRHPTADRITRQATASSQSLA
ncbi:MAG: hypothetical protein WBW87_15145 [Candidatus Cybelea sp.]